jgi:hypothetical protein
MPAETAARFNPTSSPVTRSERVPRRGGDTDPPSLTNSVTEVDVVASSKPSKDSGYSPKKSHVSGLSGSNHDGWSTSGEVYNLCPSASLRSEHSEHREKSRLGSSKSTYAWVRATLTISRPPSSRYPE